MPYSRWEKVELANQVAYALRHRRDGELFAAAYGITAPLGGGSLLSRLLVSSPRQRTSLVLELSTQSDGDLEELAVALGVDPSDAVRRGPPVVPQSRRAVLNSGVERLGVAKDELSRVLRELEKQVDIGGDEVNVAQTERDILILREVVAPLIIEAQEDLQLTLAGTRTIADALASIQVRAGVLERLQKAVVSPRGLAALQVLIGATQTVIQLMVAKG